MGRARAAPCPLRTGAGNLDLQLGLKDNALLLARVRARSDSNHRLGLTAVDGHVRDARRDVDVVAGAGDLMVTQVLAVPEVDLATHHVYRRLVLLVEVRLRLGSRRHADYPEPNGPRADGFGADATRVERPLLALVGLDRANDSARQHGLGCRLHRGLLQLNSTRSLER